MNLRIHLKVVITILTIVGIVALFTVFPILIGVTGFVFMVGGIYWLLYDMFSAMP